MSEVRDEIKNRLLEASVPPTHVEDLSLKIERQPDLYGKELEKRLKSLEVPLAAAMEIVETVPRPVSPPAVAAVRTLIGSGAVATVLIGVIGISNPVTAAAALAVSTGILKGLGTWARDTLDAEVKGWRLYVARVFNWLG